MQHIIIESTATRMRHVACVSSVESRLYGPRGHMVSDFKLYTFEVEISNKSEKRLKMDFH